MGRLMYEFHALKALLPKFGVANAVPATGERQGYTIDASDMEADEGTNEPSMRTDDYMRDPYMTHAMELLQTDDPSDPEVHELSKVLARQFNKVRRAVPSLDDVFDRQRTMKPGGEVLDKGDLPVDANM